MHRKVHMQGHVMQRIAKYICNICNAMHCKSLYTIKYKYNKYHKSETSIWLITINIANELLLVKNTYINTSIFISALLLHLDLI